MGKEKQEVIDIEGTKVILIHFNDRKYFPLTQIDEKILLRQKGSTLNKADKKKVKTFKIDFKPITGSYNSQNSRCIEHDELKYILENRTQVARLSEEQKLSQNKLHRYLNIPELPIIKYDCEVYDSSSIGKHDEYTQIAIRSILDQSEVQPEGRICIKCLKEYPLHENFFYKESASLKGYSRICAVCKVSNKANTNFKFKSNDKITDMLLTKNVSYDILVNYNNNPIETLYELYLKGEISKFPIDMRTKENLFIITDNLFEEGKINESNLNTRTLKNEFKLSINLYENTKLTELYKRYYGEEFYLEKWKYPEYTFSEMKLTPAISKKIFSNYIKTHNIRIDDPINFDYQSIIDVCHLKNIPSLFGGICGFFVYYWEGKYAGYQFRNIGNYYRISKKNVLTDLKFLIEKDMKLKREKIPLYLTKQSLKTHASPLWNHIVMKRNGSIFSWVNEIYPDRFDIMDFEIGKYRNNFDSVEEEQVDGVLREYFDSVVYNYNNSDQVVTLKNKRPDWFIMTETGVWLVEYFGMYIEKQMYNDIIRSYIDGVHEKLKLYEELEGYKFLFVYPSDIEKGFSGLRVKLDEIVNEGRRIGA